MWHKETFTRVLFIWINCFAVAYTHRNIKDVQNSIPGRHEFADWIRSFQFVWTDTTEIRNQENIGMSTNVEIDSVGYYKSLFAPLFITQNERE